MKLLASILIVFLLFGCKKKVYVITNLNNNEIEIMGHGGMGYTSLYPINTGESIIRCMNEDADGSEIDIQLTADNVLVAFHNSHLDENTNFTGRIRDHTWSQLKEARYTSTPQLNYKILKLRDFFDIVGSMDSYTFTLDIKLYHDEDFYDYVEDFTDALEDLYADYSIHSNVFIESQSEYFLNEIHAKDTDVERYIYPQSFDEGYETALDLGLRGISISNDLITKEQVEKAHSMGLFVTLWGVRIASGNIEAIEKSPDMIQTDNINHLVKMLK